MSETAYPPAGWYPDPSNGHLRWWDGSRWGAYAPAPQPPLPWKSTGVGYLFLLLLGGFAAHLFYLRQYPAAITFLVVWWGGWALSPFGVGYVMVLAGVIWLIVSLFTMPSDIRAVNATIATTGS